MEKGFNLVEKLSNPGYVPIFSVGTGLGAGQHFEVKVRKTDGTGVVSASFFIYRDDG